ncbi:MAG: hypothetical protein Q4F41_15580 [Eubacteriales bacterium]|nr:hypothetical protein [Eubacteriales bacterium]
METIFDYQLSDQDSLLLMKATNPPINTYTRNEVIKTDSNNRMLYLVLEGNVYLCTQNTHYDVEIMACFSKGCIFPGALITYYDEICSKHFFRFAVCKTKCRIAVIDAESAVQYCVSRRSSKMTYSLLEFSYQFVTVSLAWHCHILQQKTVRDKIMAFFLSQLEYCQTEHYHLSIPYSDLSNFLQVERTALMKELKKMEVDRVIERNGRDIIFLQ